MDKDRSVVLINILLSPFLSFQRRATHVVFYSILLIILIFLLTSGDTINIYNLFFEVPQSCF